MTATPPRFVDPEQFDLTPVHLSSAEVQPDAYRSELPSGSQAEPAMRVGSRRREYRNRQPNNRAIDDDHVPNRSEGTVGGGAAG